MPREAVVWAYRLLLDREPESDAVVAGNAAPSIDALVGEILTGEEFLSRNAAAMLALCPPLEDTGDPQTCED